MHVPVLAGPALEWLAVREDGVYVDCTAGAGGHTALIAQRIVTGRVFALDRDAEAVRRARAFLAPYPHVEVVQRNYGELADVLCESGIDRVDGILLDAGLSSVQLDDPLRGFAFQGEGPLDMRMDRSEGPTAEAYLREVEEKELARVLKDYGDLRKARRIAGTIVGRRDADRMKTTGDLAAAVAEVFDFVRGVPEETRRVFQAIRIAVNEELRWLDACLRQAVPLLAPGGRLVGISFHSGEDRIIKTVLQEASRRRRVLYPDGRLKEVVPPVLEVLTRKPVLPSAEELRANPRAHSAKLRAARRLEPEGMAS